MWDPVSDVESSSEARLDAAGLWEEPRRGTNAFEEGRAEEIDRGVVYLSSGWGYGEG